MHRGVAMMQPAKARFRKGNLEIALEDAGL